MNKTVFLLLGFLFLGILSNAQKRDVKSLIEEIQNLKLGSDSTYYFELKKESIAFFRQNNAEDVLGELSMEWGFFYENHFKPDSSKKYYSQALNFFTSEMDSLYMALVLYGLAGALHDTEDYLKSADYYLKSLDLYREVGTDKDVADALNAIGGVYYLAGDLEIAKDYYLESAVIQKTLGNTSGETMALGNLGAVYEYLDLDTAILFYEEAMSKAKANNDSIQMVDMYTGLGLVMLRKEKLDIALDYFQKSLEDSKKLNSRSQLGYSYQNMAFYYLEVDEFGLAESYANQALKMSDELSDFQLESNALEVLHEVYFNTGRSRKAYTTLNGLRTDLDSIYDLNSAKQLSSMKGEYELTLQQNEKMKEDLIVQNLKVQSARETNIKVGLAAVIFVLFIITVIILRNQQLQKRTNELLKHRNEEIESKNNKIEELERVRNKWFNNIAHELRTPLTLIKGPIEYLTKGENLDEDSTEMLKIAHRNVGRLDKLTSEILDLSKLDDGQLKLRASVIELGASIGEIVNSFKAQSEKEGVSLELNIPKGPVYAKIDEEKIQQSISSLVSNAIKFSAEGGEVNVTLSDEIDEIIIRVADKGEGIDKEDIPKIFDRYFQSPTATKGAKAGSGVGLSLCKEYVELHKGYVTVESQISSGSSFEIHLPSTLKIRGTEYEEIIESSESEDKGKKPKLILNGKSIFISDDSSDMREYIMSFLQEKFSVKPFRDGKDLLNELQHQVPDLIITDLMMPRMNGSALIKKLKANEKYRAIPVVIISAVMEENERLETLRLGVDDYITKPFNPEELVIRIENLLINYNERQKALEFEDIDEKASFSEKLLKTLEEEIKDNVGDPNFNVIRLADAGSLSKRQLYRYLKQTTGFTPGNFIKEIRLQKAFELARRNIYTTTSELAYAVGFQHPSYFSGVFKERFGKKPSEFFKEKS